MERKHSFPYPRRSLYRNAIRLGGRMLMPLLTDPRVSGRQHFPRRGPLIVAGNHTAAMEVVMMTLYTPRQVEYMGSIDIPHESLIRFFVQTYGIIPVFRGNTSRSAMQAGLDVLHQGGVLGVFPEGGIWEPSIRRAHTGVAWLSYHGRAPVVPVGFGSMRGVLRQLLTLKRPILKMNIGEMLPPVEVPPGRPTKVHLQEAADQIMAAIWALIPLEDQGQEEAIRDEQFELQLDARDRSAASIPIPDRLMLRHGAALSKFIHRWTLINNFQANLNIDVAALMHLADGPAPQVVRAATGRILAYLEGENPYYFTYRYGQREGSAMETGIRELDALAAWADQNQVRFTATPIRRYTLMATGEQVSLDRPQQSDKW
ncbi:MAG: 1-acyl-sn-glycerol-3-phosphate acyltransferase [Anaerolineales bacterium]|nr:1-acyl-sn-glycerol-3-phosphate acyltransferase [Anaerolineales bacterium]